MGDRRRETARATADVSEVVSQGGSRVSGRGGGGGEGDVAPVTLYGRFYYNEEDDDGIGKHVLIMDARSTCGFETESVVVVGSSEIIR